MDLRKVILEPVEKALMKLLDENVKNVGKEMIKEQAHKAVDKLVDDNYDKLVKGFIEGARKLIDKIDGVDSTAAPAPSADPQSTVKPGAV